MKVSEIQFLILQTLFVFYFSLNTLSCSFLLWSVQLVVWNFLCSVCKRSGLWPSNQNRTRRLTYSVRFLCLLKGQCISMEATQFRWIHWQWDHNETEGLCGFTVHWVDSSQMSHLLNLEEHKSIQDGTVKTNVSVF